MRHIWILLLAATTSFIPAPQVSKHFHIQKLAPGIWAAIQSDPNGHAICNAGIVDLGNKTVIFDPFITPEAARDLKKEAEILTGRKVSFVVNSHYHNDHIRGDQVFVPGAVVISTEWTRNEIYASEKEEQEWERKNAASSALAERKKIATAAEDQKPELRMWAAYYEGIQHSLPELRIVVPEIGFSDSFWIHGSRQDIKLLECRNGHTRSDLVMLIPKAGVAFMGDLFFVNRHPWFGDGDDAMLKQYVRHFRQDSSLTIYIPGHGPVAGKPAMQQMEDYINDLQELTKKGFEGGQPDSVILQLPMPVAYQQWWFGRFYKPNIQFLCDKLHK